MTVITGHYKTILFVHQNKIRKMLRHHVEYNVFWTCFYVERTTPSRPWIMWSNMNLHWSRRRYDKNLFRQWKCFSRRTQLTRVKRTCVCNGTVIISAGNSWRVTILTRVDRGRPAGGSDGKRGTSGVGSRSRTRRNGEGGERERDYPWWGR